MTVGREPLLAAHQPERREVGRRNDISQPSKRLKQKVHELKTGLGWWDLVHVIPYGSILVRFTVDLTQHRNHLEIKKSLNRRNCLYQVVCGNVYEGVS